MALRTIVLIGSENSDNQDAVGYDLGSLEIYSFETIFKEGFMATTAVRSENFTSWTGAGLPAIPSWFGLNIDVHSIFSSEENEPHTILYTSGTSGSKYMYL
jgi:hypothetical protein